MTARIEAPTRPTTMKKRSVYCRQCMLPVVKCLCFGTSHEMSLWVDAIRDIACRARANKRWSSR
jgi:hypothetical protein